MPTVGGPDQPVNKKLRLGGPEYGVNSQPGPQHQQMMTQQSMNASMSQQSSSQMQSNMMYGGQNSQQQFQRYN